MFLVLFVVIVFIFVVHGSSAGAPSNFVVSPRIMTIKNILFYSMWSEAMEQFEYGT